jgi:hypothetical protein
MKLKKERIDKIRELNSLGLRDILKLGYDESVKLSLPPGAPTYEKSASPTSHLDIETKNLRYFLASNTNRLQSAQIERKFIQILESIAPEDAELLIACKDKQLKGRYKNITKKFVSDAFPGLIQA